MFPHVFTNVLTCFSGLLCAAPAFTQLLLTGFETSSSTECQTGSTKVNLFMGCVVYACAYGGIIFRRRFAQHSSFSIYPLLSWGGRGRATVMILVCREVLWGRQYQHLSSSPVCPSNMGKEGRPLGHNHRCTNGLR